MARRIRKAKIDFISLVPRGANKMQAIYKSDGSVVIDALTKVDGEAGELTAVVYAPEHEDSQGHVADAKVIKEMAYEYQRDRRQLDLRHDGEALSKEQAYVAENFIVARGDQRFVGWKDTEGQPVNLEGAWATVIKLEDPGLRRLARDEKWSVSMGGTGVIEKQDDGLDLFRKHFRQVIGLTEPRNEEEIMALDAKDVELLSKAVTEANKPVTEAITALAKALAPKQPAESTGGTPATPELKEPVYKGRDDDEAALRKHERALEYFHLRKEADLTTPEGVKAFREAGNELRKRHAEEDEEARVEKRSNQSGDGEEGDEPVSKERETRVVGIAKSDKQLLKAGTQAAKDAWSKKTA